MWEINKLYLDTQIQKNVTFVFSKSPADYIDISNDSFGEELRYLRDNHYDVLSDNVDISGYYVAVRRIEE